MLLLFLQMTTVLRLGFLQNGTFGQDRADSGTRLKASGAAGGVAGAFRGVITRNPRSVLAGILIYGSIGLGGQKLYDVADGMHTAHLVEKERTKDMPRLTGWWRFVDTIAGMKYSPLKRMSDREYEEKLQEQLIAVEADIALINERIEEARREGQSKEEAQEQKSQTK